MKILAAALAAVILMSAPTPVPVRAPVQGEIYEIDPVHSFALFRIRHLDIGYVWGRINAPTGTVLLDEKSPARSSVSVELKVENVDTGVEKRDQHLKSPDFFNGKQFPTLAFRSTSVRKTGDATFDVTGDFTLLGETRPVTVPVTRVGGGKDPWGGMRAGFEGSFTIKRSDFGMKHMLEVAGDEVQITLAVQAVRK